MASELLYNEASPGQEHGDVIRCVWSLRGQADGRAADPIVSDGCVELVFNLADPFEQVVAESGRSTRQPLAMVVGPTALPTVVRPTGTIDVVGVRLQPWAGASVLGLPMRELRDRFAPLADVVGKRLADMPEQLHALRNDVARLDFAPRMLATCVSKAVSGASRTAVEQIPGSGDAPSVRELARRLGRSVRTLQRTFAEDVGLSPKTLLRIARIQRALTLARSATPLRWSAIAVRAGYHDQSHFVREFRALVGCAPSEFRPEEASLTSSFLSSG